jgi:hypothetical protein
MLSSLLKKDFFMLGGVHPHDDPGAHVVGEYSVEIIQLVAACLANGMRVEQLAELQLAYSTFTEAVGMAAQKLVCELGLAPLSQLWSNIK